MASSRASSAEPEAVERLRRVLDHEESRKYADTAVIGGLDRYFQRFLNETGLPTRHPLRQLLASLPGAGYRELHPVQRKRVIEEIRKALDEKWSSAGPASRSAPSEGTAAKIESKAPVKATPGKPVTAKSVTQQPAPITLDTPISALKVGRQDEQKFARIGIRTVRDLLFHFPTRHHDYSTVRPVSFLQPDEEQSLIATVMSVGAGEIGRRKASEAIVGDNSGVLRVVWWGQPWIARQLRQGSKVALSGKVTVFRGRPQMENPEFEPADGESLNTRRVVPQYPSTEGLHQHTIRRLAIAALQAAADAISEDLPQAVLKRQRLPVIADALRQFHFPEILEDADRARRRFALQELLNIELGVVRRRREWQSDAGAPRLALPKERLDGFLSSLPFALTGAQRRAIDDILKDASLPVPMSRLLEGDVGSGKTVVAAAALLAAVESGRQGAIMAPTEILAEQHFRTFTTILGNDQDNRDPGVLRLQAHNPGLTVLQPPFLPKPLRVALLTGSLKASEKTAAQEAIARGEVDIAVGTQALIQEGVDFPSLGLVVVDEQHRFGVVQRAALREKGTRPHVLVMTATPIPRTLALTIYGDLDISVLKDMPPGRPPVKTYRLRPNERQKAYEFVRKKVQEGRQSYVICPLVEESETIEARAAVQEYERLSADVFPDLRLGLLHGRMNPGEKNTTMGAFRDHEIDVLVTTAVVEVGVDVPNATTILIEGADRFGLAQLHQFRGRVRRSSEQAYCILLSDSQSTEANDRLKIMETVHDGFQLAEEDLRLRGPGEYFGVRQSGLPDLKVAKLTDVELIETARGEAARILDEDPQLQRPEHAALRRRMEEVWGRISAEVS